MRQAVVFGEQDTLFCKVVDTGVLLDFVEILSQRSVYAGRLQGGASTWFSSHIVMNLSNAFPGTYAAVAAVAAAVKSKNRMVIKIYRCRREIEVFAFVIVQRTWWWICLRGMGSGVEMFQYLAFRGRVLTCPMGPRNVLVARRIINPSPPFQSEF
jgi:hypothetical protein